MSKHRLPKHVQAYVTPWGKQVYYLRRPGRPKVRIEVADDVPPWSPAFMAALEQRIRELRAEGVGILRIGRTLGVGTSVVQRVLAAPSA